MKVAYYRTSMIVTRGSKFGPNSWQQHHHRARDALRSASKGERTFTSICARWQHDEIDLTGNLSFLMIGRTHGSGTWTTSCTLTLNHNAPQLQRERYVNLLHLRSLDKNKQAGPLWQRREYGEAKKGTVKSTQGKKTRTSSLYSST